MHLIAYQKRQRLFSSELMVRASFLVGSSVRSSREEKGCFFAELQSTTQRAVQLWLQRSSVLGVRRAGDKPQLSFFALASARLTSVRCCYLPRPVEDVAKTKSAFAQMVFDSSARFPDDYVFWNKQRERGFFYRGCPGSGSCTTALRSFYSTLDGCAV